jgi:hypothetical protein
VYDRYGKDGQHANLLGRKMEDLIFMVADTNFFFNDLEDCDQVSVRPLSDLKSEPQIWFHLLLPLERHRPILPDFQPI